MKIINDCPNCGKSSFTPHSSALYWQVIELNFVECAECGLIFTNPMPGMDVVSEGNKALNILHTSRGTISQYRGGKEFSYTLRNFRKKGTMLDVGCAEAIFLKGVQDNSDWKAEGVEIIKSAVDFANNQLGVFVHFGTLDTLENRDNYYDYIRMNNVIEHVQDPKSFLQKAFHLLKPGGKIYCTTPNGVQDGAVLKTANKRHKKINLLENHFYYYPPKTLRNIFESSGFKITHAYSEDISHSLQDFGITGGLKIPELKPETNLEYYKNKTNSNFLLSSEEIENYKNDVSAKSWKIILEKYYKEIFRFRFPYFLPLGHQQHIYAVKE